MVRIVMGMIKHSQIAQTNKLAISLQYFQKDVMTGVHYGFHQYQNFCKLDYWFLIKAGMSKVPQKREFVKVLQYIKKKYCNCFCILLWCKTFRYFARSQSCLLLLVFANIPTVSILPGQSVPVCGMLFQCSGLNQFVLVFMSLIKKIFIFT